MLPADPTYVTPPRVRPSTLSTYEEIDQIQSIVIARASSRLEVGHAEGDTCLHSEPLSRSVPRSCVRFECTTTGVPVGHGSVGVLQAEVELLKESCKVVPFLVGKAGHKRHLAPVVGLHSMLDCTSPFLGEVDQDARPAVRVRGA